MGKKEINSAEILLNAIKKFKNKYGENIIPQPGKEGHVAEFASRTIPIINNKILLSKGYSPNLDYLNLEAALIYGLIKWRSTKKVYRFSKDLLDILNMESLFSFDIPVDIIMDRLINGIFIEYHHPGYQIGSIYHIEKSGEFIDLIALSVPECVDKKSVVNGSIAITLRPGLTFKTALAEYISNVKKNNKGMYIDKKHFEKLFITAMAPLVYVLTDNADIEHDPDNSKYYRAMDINNIKDRLREVQIFNVGYNVSTHIRNTKDFHEKIVLSGNSKAYIRAAHWRGSWSGRRDTLKLSFILPTIINKDADTPDDDSLIEQPEQTEYYADLIAEIDRQRLEIDKRDKDILKLQRDYSNLEKRYQALKESSMSDKRELISLRSILFTRQNGDCYDEVEPAPISFPWYTNKKITVFGGHPTWINKIKPMLPNIRFVDKTSQSVNQNLILNSDVIWVQTNAMSHSLYNSIMSIVRQYNKPIKYFKYASSEKCAIQLVEEMSK